MLLKKSKGILGLDIGTSGVKVVKLEERKKVISLKV
jgi:Tfp pilus assembly PilM family ATPase